MTALEKEVKKKISEYLTELGCYYHMHVPVGYGKTTIDYLGCYRGLFFGIEAKRARGLKDFSPASQDKAAWWLANRDYKRSTGHDLEADLKSGKFDPRGLQNTWVSIRNLGADKWAHRFYDGATTTLASAGTGSGSGDSPSTAGATSFNMPESKAKDDLTAAKGPDLSGGQSQQSQQKQAGGGAGAGGGKGGGFKAKNYVEVP